MPGRSWLAGESCGDGEPEGRDRPLEKGVGGIDSGARSVRVWDRVPMKNKTEGGKSSLGQPCCLSLPFIEGHVVLHVYFPFLSAFTILQEV